MFEEAYALRLAYETYKYNIINFIFNDLIAFSDKNIGTNSNFRVLSNLLLKKSSAQNILISKFGWICHEKSYEYRDNFRYDSEKKDIFYDSHSITKGEDDLYTQDGDSVSENFLFSHMQLFESISDLENAIKKERDKSPTQLNENSSHDFDFVARYNEKEVIKKVLSNELLCKRYVIKWLNRLNEPMEFSASNVFSIKEELFRDLDEIDDLFTENGELSPFECYEFKWAILVILDIFHARGYDLRLSSELGTIRSDDYHQPFYYHYPGNHTEFPMFPSFVIPHTVKKNRGGKL